MKMIILSLLFLGPLSGCAYASLLTMIPDPQTFFAKDAYTVAQERCAPKLVRVMNDDPDNIIFGCEGEQYKKQEL